jgi:hypothetical protein
MFGHGTATVEWWATDPKFYSLGEETVSTGIYSPTFAGLTFDATADFYFGGAVPSGVVQAVNEGEISAPWVATFTGPLTDPRVENVTLGKAVRLVGELGEGQTLTIDSASRTVRLGNASRYSWVRVGSSWWDLVPGTNLVRLTAADGTGTGMLTYRSAWI